MDSPFVLAFIVGLFSNVHCLGMCGSIMGALSLSLPDEIKCHQPRLLSYIGMYNLGRILTYVLFGVLAGLSGKALELGVGDLLWRQILTAIAALALVLAGLYIAGWLTWLRRLEWLGAPLWRRLEPIGRKLLPVKSPSGALLAGLIWGCLPCGLVYYALFLTLTLNSPWQGGVAMALFGLGTLPGMMGIGTFSGWLVRVRGKAWVQQLAGGALIVMGLIFAVEGFLIAPGVEGFS